MTTDLNKKILISPELLSSAVGLFFQERGFELCVQHVEGEHYHFAIDSIFPELEHIPRLQVSKTILPKLAEHVRGFIDPIYFNNENGKKLLSSHFSDAQELDLIERYSENLKTVYNVKMQDYLNVGFFIDSIIVDAYKADFDINMMRDYLNIAMNFAFKKVEVTALTMPIDVSYSHDDSAFVVELSMHVDSFAGKEEFKNTFNELLSNSNYIDVTYFPKKNKLSISSLIFKEPSLKKGHAYFFTEVSRRLVIDGDLQTNLYSGLMIKDGLDYALQPTPMAEAETKLQIARKFALFIKNLRKKDGVTSVLERSEVDSYLSLYPRESTAVEIDEEIKDLTFRILKGNETQGMSEYIQRVSGSNLNDEVSEIQKILGNKSLSDLEEIATIKNISSDNPLPYAIKAWLEAEEETQRISGIEPQTKEEIWALKTNKLNERIQEELVRVRSEGQNIVLDDILRVVSSELNTSPEEIRSIMEWVVEEVVTTEISKNKKLEELFSLDLIRSKEEVVEDDSTKISNEVLAANEILIDKLQDQNSRMKKIMEQMKRELIKHQNEKMGAVETSNIELLAEKEESKKLKAALELAMKNIQSKNKAMEKLRRDVESNFKLKDEKISILEDKIEKLTHEQSKLVTVVDSQKFDELDSENKLLKTRLELAQRKSAVDAGNNENSANELIEKHEKEIDSLKLSVTMAQVLIERLKHDKQEMETRFQEEKSVILNEHEEKLMELVGNSRPDANAKKDGPITALTNEKKILEDKLRAQGIELKKLEQKLKFANSQLDSSSSKKDAKSSAKNSEAYAKQLETVSAKLEAATAEISDKRKEVHKYKLENATLSMRITDLEKKLGIQDKKAS